MRSNSSQTLLRQIHAIIERELDNDQLNGEIIAKRLYMSRAKLYRIIKALTNQSVNIYVRRYRLHRAKTMLKNPNLSVADVAFDTGFNNPNYFSALFAKEFGVPPSRYRGGERVRG